MGEVELLGLIEENIRHLASVQIDVNTHYKNLNTDDYTEEYQKIIQGLYMEKDLLNALINNLNKYFNISSRWWFKRFRIIEESFSFGRYTIKPPVRLDKSTWQYTLLKKLLMDLHDEYFLHSGMVDYAFSSLESHMWEIPNFIEDNEVVRSIRKSKGL